MGVALVLAGVLGVSSGTRQEARAAMQGHGLVGVVGHWTSIDDEGPAFKGDGGRWSGQTSRAELGRVRGVLFPVLSESFVASATASGAFPLAVYRDATNFTQGTVRTRFKLIGGTDDRNAGIVVGLDTSGAYFFVRYNTKDGNVAVWRYAGGERQVLAHGEAHEQLAPGAWHELVVTVGGGKVKGEVSGRGLTVEYTLDRPLNGRVGLWTKRDAVTAFKDFRVSHQVNVPGRGT
jgi:hypothetical protein